MAEAQTITVTGLFGFMPSFGIYLLLEPHGRFYIAHAPDIAALYEGERVEATGRERGPNLLWIDSLRRVPPTA